MVVFSLCGSRNVVVVVVDVVVVVVVAVVVVVVVVVFVVVAVVCPGHETLLFRSSLGELISSHIQQHRQ